MRQKNIIWLWLLFSLFSIDLLAQVNTRTTGLIFNDSEYSKIPVAAKLTRGEFTNLPIRFSIKKYATIPSNQGQTGTCVAWSSAYGAFTIVESIKQNRTNPEITTSEAFSPSFIYNQIRKVA